MKDQTLQLMVLEHRTPQEMDANEDQEFILLGAARTDDSGRFRLEIPATDTPGRFIAPDGFVNARLITSEMDLEAMVHHVVEFNLSGEGSATDDHIKEPTGELLAVSQTIDLSTNAVNGSQ